MKKNKIFKFAQGGAIAGMAAKKLGLEGVELLAGAAMKAGAEAAANSLAKQMGTKLISQLPIVAGKEASAVAEIVANAVEKKIAAGALQSAKEGSDIIAKQIVKELEKDGIKVAPQLIEETLLNARGVDVLKRLATAAGTGTEQEFIKKLTSQEIPALRNTLMKAMQTEGAPTEIKQMFVTMLNNSPKFSAGVYAEQVVQAAIPALKTMLKATTDPIGLLSQKLSTKAPTVSKWLAERTVTRIGVGIFTATATFSSIKNLRETLFTNFTNLQDIVSTINSNLQSYNFSDPNWANLVKGFEQRLNDGLKEHNEAKMIQFSQNETEDSAKEKTNTLLKKSITGDEKLKRCFMALSSKEFKSIFDAINNVESSKMGTVADTTLGIAETVTRIDVKNITIVQDAAQRGLKLIDTNDGNTDKLLSNLDKSIAQDKQTTTTQKTTKETNPMSLVGLYKILDAYIKVGSILRNLKK